MSFQKNRALLASLAIFAMPASAWAFTGPGGCASLPEYYRALGVLQGGMESACNMSVEQANRIVAGYRGATSADQPISARRHHGSLR